jgi:hypothetical protein
MATESSRSTAFERRIKESPARGPGSSGGFKISRSGRKSSSEKKYSVCK